MVLPPLTAQPDDGHEPTRRSVFTTAPPTSAPYREARQSTNIMRGSKAAAEVAALEGLLSSPDTQECRRIFQASMGCDFDSQSLLSIDDGPSINKPQLSRSGVSLPLSHLHAVVPGIGIFSRSQHAGLLTKAQAALSLHPGPPPLPGTSCRDPDRPHSDSLDPQEHSRAQQIHVHPARPSALHKRIDTPISSCANGIAVTAGSRAAKMDDFISPLGGSDGSNLSPTQENDPAVYIRLQEELQALPPVSQSPDHPFIGATQDATSSNRSALGAQDTGVTYTVNDTGHLTLDYQPAPSNPLLDSFDEDEVGEISSGKLRPQLFEGGLLHPQTPAQARLLIGHPGTIMRPSQMFAETQPSPGSRGRHLLPPSSSRPSPDLFNQYQSPKLLTSSPLVRRVGKMQSEHAAGFHISSSPEHSQSEGNGSQKTSIHQPLLDRTDDLKNTRLVSPITGNVMQQNFPEPFDVYTTRKESQERRRQQARVFDDAEQSSDDGFSDDDADLNRRAKQRKDEAARALAVISTSRPGSAGKDFVEVPSTNTGRRRTQAKEYEAQCLGSDARDTQPDATIVDSQSMPAGITALSGETTSLRNDNVFCHSDPHTFHRQDYSQEDTAHSGKTADDESSGQLPALDRNEDSEATESDREDSNSPVSQHGTSQIASNIAELRTPTLHKKLPYVDGDTIVPETSPSEPHLQRYGDIVSQTPPVLSAEELDDAFNPFTQDMEFNDLIQSPSPRRTRSVQAAQSKVVTSDTNLNPDLEAMEGGRRTKGSGSNAKSSSAEQLENGVSTSSAAKENVSDYTSEYVTAPTSLTLENLSIPKPQSNFRTGCINISFQAPGATDLPRIITQDSGINPAETPLVDGQVSVSEVKQQVFHTGMREGQPLLLTSLPHGSTKFLESDKTNHDFGTAEEMLMTDHPESPPARKTRLTPRPSKRHAKQSKASFGKTTDVTPVIFAAEPSDILPNRLRSATQLRGSSRALRRLLEDNVPGPSTPVPTNATSTPVVQKITRSSRWSSTNSSEKAQSTEPEANINPILSTIRRTPSVQLSEPGLFDGMVFSVTYSANREEVKQHVLGLIKKNGGRVLEKGFDELFDMNSLQTGSVSRNNEASSFSDASSLTLTAAARGLGFACVIADEHSRRVKYMQALALGLPCISGRWIEHCVARKEILDWEQYHLAAGESSFLGGAVRSRNLPSYPASTANFAIRFASRPKLLSGKSILLITGKGRVEERRKPYFFLTQALGARRVKHVPNTQEARKFLLEAESNGEEWNWVFVGENEDEAEKTIFGAGMAPPKKRKRGSEASDNCENSAPPPKKVRIVSDEYVIQSLILGKFWEE